MVEYTALLGLDAVPVLYRGPYDVNQVKACFRGKSTFAGSLQEGYVMRLAASIPWSRHRSGFGKVVRKGHVQTADHWMHRAVVENELKDTENGR